ncbi:MAG: hypothetical protein WCK81_02305 [Betaproteobacteria bacterium]
MKFPWMAAQHAPALAGAMGALVCAVAVLASCGGQGSSNTNTTSTPSSNTQTTSSPSSTLAGGYQGTVSSDGNAYTSDFVSFVTPGLAWYALYYLRSSDASIYPVIFKGQLSSVSASSASISSPGLTAFQFGNRLGTGGATLSNASVSGYQIALSGITLTNNQVNPSFAPSAMATYTTSTGSWAGTLTDNLSTASTDLTLTFNSSGTLTSDSSYANCPLALTLTPESQTSNPYFSATLAIAAHTGCLRAPASTAITLTGIGFIHASTVSGKTKRLELVLTDSTGSGISFRGDQ